MDERITRVLRAVQGEVWAISPAKLAEIGNVAATRAAGGLKLSADEVTALTRPKPSAQRTGYVAVLPVFGIIAQRMDMMTAFSGGTSTEALGQEFDALIEDASVTAIILDVDSPGGSVAGVLELSDKIFAARGKKPIYAIANPLAASAAYVIASAADEVIITQLGFAGSLNAIMIRVDVSAADEKQGVRYHFLTGGPTDYKAEGHPHFPVSDEELAATQANIDVAYDALVQAVARNRGISAKDVIANYGEGRIYIGPRAVDAGVANRISTLDALLEELTGSANPSKRRMAAAVEQLPLAARYPGDQLPVATFDVQAPPVGASHHVYAGVDAGDHTITAGAAATITLIPREITEPAPVARSVPMSEQGTATAQPGAGTDPIAAEKLRLSNLTALLNQEPQLVTAQMFAQWVNAGVSHETAAAEVMRLQRDRATSSPAVRPGATREHQQPFANFGEQIQAVIIAGGGSEFLPSVHPPTAIGRLQHMQAAATGHSATVGSDGAWLVGTQTEQGLMKRAYDRSILASRCNETPIGAAFDSLETMAIKESSRATGSRYGGIRFYRAAEAETVTPSKLGLEKFKVELDDLFAVTYLTERLMQDAPAMQKEVEDAFEEEGAFVIDDEIFRGSGAGQMQGVVSAPSVVTITKETGQTAASVLAKNVQKIWARVWVRSQTNPNGIWVYNQALFPELQNMQVGTGTSAQLVFMPPGGLSGSPYGSIYGRPAIPLEQASAPGTLGDLGYVDLSQYKLIRKGGTQVAESMHVRFLYNERALRFLIRINGKPRWSSALTPYKGTDSVSPFVFLGARA